MKMKEKTLNLKRIRYSIQERIDIEKVALYAVIINSVQIIAALLVVVLAFIRNGHLISGNVEIAVLCAMAAVVVWGAVVDIREASIAREIQKQADMLKDANAQLEVLNGTLRAQRHDFMNHLQVVYSLLELEEHEEAKMYIERVYGDIQRVGRTLKTAIPAVNALLAAKLSDCDQRGIRVQFHIDSAWEELPVSGWEMCRVLGNLLDNTIDALKDTREPELTIVLSENIHAFTFCIENNGPTIPKALMEKIFQNGFSTKSVGRGMGLAIVKQILESNRGTIHVISGENITRFEGVIEKDRVST